MPKIKLTTLHDFMILDGIYRNIPDKYLAEFFEVSEQAIKIRAKKLEGTEKQEVHREYCNSYSEYVNQSLRCVCGDSQTWPTAPNEEDTGIDKVIETFGLEKSIIRLVEHYMDKLADKCLFIYKDLRRSA